MRRKTWTAAENAEFARLYPDTDTTALAIYFGVSERAIYAHKDSFDPPLRKSRGYLQAVWKETAARRKRAGIEDGQFRAGQTPWNKGLRGWSPPGTERTQFKPGDRPHTWHPIGHVRVTSDGYSERKLTDTGCTRRDYVGLHILLWREHHGEIPAGHIVTFRNGNKADIRIENLDCISRAEHVRRNSIHRYPPEIKTAIRRVAKLKRTIQEAHRGDLHD